MRRVLVVDDEAEGVSALEEYLNARNFEVHTATDGPSALEKVKQIRPEVVLLDIIMPGMNGIEVLRGIRQIDPEIKVIVITALSEEHSKNAMALGAHGFITKPFDLAFIDKVLG